MEQLDAVTVFESRNGGGGCGLCDVQGFGSSGDMLPYRYFDEDPQLFEGHNVFQFQSIEIYERNNIINLFY